MPSQATCTHSAMTLKRLRHLSQIPTSSYSLVSIAELPATEENDPSLVLVKTYTRSDVSRHRLDKCVCAERDALVRLSNDHSGGVPRLLSAQVTSLNLTFVMALAPGVPASRLPRPLPLNRVARILRNLVSSLSVVHEAGIVHADIALRNVIIDYEKDDNVCLVDYGSCFLTGSGARDCSKTTTANVVPPEMLKTLFPDPTADIWALGVFAWACMFGGAGPFHGQTNAHILELIDQYGRGQFELTSRFWDSCRELGASRTSAWLHAYDFVNICLSRDPASRFAKRNTNANWKGWSYVVDYERIQAHPFLHVD
ncbi:serine/threonine protein kinase [Gracilaria domingensis]|nr:serine/threonine protein kinase [Gracilaria domingensis]